MFNNHCYHKEGHTPDHNYKLVHEEKKKPVIIRYSFKSAISFHQANKMRSDM